MMTVLMAYFSLLLCGEDSGNNQCICSYQLQLCAVLLGVFQLITIYSRYVLYKALIEGLETFRLLLFIDFHNIHGGIKILLFETFIVVLTFS